MRIVSLKSTTLSPVYAIGDVHGMHRHLKVLIDAILGDAAATDSVPRIVFLGDIIDRGENSRLAMEIVIEILEGLPGSLLILGNHDAFLLGVMDNTLNAAHAKYWMTELGGEETIRSYVGDALDTSGRVAALMATKFPQHLGVLRDAVDMVLLDDDWCLVHAGVEPGKSLAEQDLKTVRWIRGEFLFHSGEYERRIVHGHSVTDENLGAEPYPNRIGMDGGVYRGGPLCAVRIAIGETPRFIFAFGCDDDPIGVQHYSEADLAIEYRNGIA
ncbi:metallophosphoesterase [Rhizobium sp. LjRoot98]|uniref:metallophosphoesterase n=1 Tax=Rhizobium sp. LjRoot98 TaxID=3342345 RepID=UPI003ECD5C51